MIKQFLDEVSAIQKTGVAREHAYRPALQKLFNSLSEDVRAVNEPARVDVGAPDFVFLRGDIAIGHCEAKDLGTDVKVLKGYSKDQKKRYTEGFQNLIYTNCLDWRFYRDGELVAEITIADFLMGIQPREDRFAALEQMLRDFIAQTPQTITSSKRLAVRMAGKAILIKDVLARALKQDKDSGKESATELTEQYQAFRKHLIHDISLEDFADIYAETIAYGMFAARLHDDTLADFSRQEALELLPKSNPFLRNLFSYIAGPNLDPRVSWIIDDLAKVFQATDVAKIMERFGNTTQRNDPFLHFYEDFLAAYNPKKREVRGVWYTPEPVVDFIVRAVDDVLKAEFGISDGLADNRKITIDWDTGQTDKKGKPLKTRKEVHKVQILDPAAGTGTFLAQAIKHIAPRIQKSAPGLWASYVEEDLIPRLHGFELLMASYAMCHMKLEMVLREYGYKPTASPPRVSVYLTNSLEEGEAANQSLPFAQWLSNEVKEANTVKRDMPIMCVIGNPPYRGESTNKGDWIMSLMDAYKKEPGGYEKLKERNPKWINDDYVKFIRMSESMIEKNGEGVLGFITNHGYLDNPTFRGMRWHLLKTFDKIYVLDLHGNAKKKEVTPDGSPDKNVFDIQQGVAIIIGVKTKPTIQGDKRKKGTDTPLATVYHVDLWGDRKEKYAMLWEGSISSIDWTPLEIRGPNFYFFNRDWNAVDAYEAGFAVEDFLPLNSVGVVTARDALTIDFDKQVVWNRVQDFKSGDPEILRQKYSL
ncbi:MAG TPA: DNA methyltransferase, partial [Hyphomonas atlantica]|nr:DNA methyltransferase [Hyphomonas atlantica]